VADVSGLVPSSEQRTMAYTFAIEETCVSTKAYVYQILCPRRYGALHKYFAEFSPPKF